MGILRINVKGSFTPNQIKEFSAMRNGHAAAVGEAIKWLASEVLPTAIRRDHELQEEKCYPEGPFGHD